MPMLRFRSPPREGRIPPGPRSRHRCCRFQSPPREGRIVQNSGTTSGTSVFPVTSPRGEDPPSGRLQTSGHSFQSPPREGRIAATPATLAIIQGFQSPPREGRILVAGHDCQQRGRFQSPPREGRILPVLPLQRFRRDVSSHLPARGGSWPIDDLDVTDWFPVTSPRGEDRYGRLYDRKSRMFPVTSPRGEDQQNQPD